MSDTTEVKNPACPACGHEDFIYFVEERRLQRVELVVGEHDDYDVNDSTSEVKEVFDEWVECSNCHATFRLYDVFNGVKEKMRKEGLLE